MDFQLNDEQLQLKKSVREFAEREIAPNVMKWDEESHFPMETVKEIAKLGLMGSIRVGRHRFNGPRQRVHERHQRTELVRAEVALDRRITPADHRLRLLRPLGHPVGDDLLE